MTVAYDGTAFVGSQLQLHPGRKSRTVQGELEAAVAELVGQPVRVRLAGRTDSGVHATGQVVAFQPPTSSRLQVEDWQRALNALLPPDVRVWQVEMVSDEFEPRFSAKRRSYEYTIWQGPVLLPNERFYCYHVAYPLNVVAMDAACKLLIGEHDFASFAGDGFGQQAGEGRPSTVRRMDEASCMVTGEWPEVAARKLVVRLTANAFLPHMVRNIVGTLLRVGRGKLTIDNFAEVLAAHSRRAAGATAPPQGLTLVRVEY